MHNKIILFFYFDKYSLGPTVVPTKSDSDMVFCLQLLSQLLT